MSPETPTTWPAYMKVRTAAEYLDCSEGLVRKLVKSGALATVSLGADRRIPRAALDALVARGMAAAHSADAILEEIRASRRA